MALVKCPECGAEISDKAKSCPKCGYPLDSEVNSLRNTDFSSNSSDDGANKGQPTGTSVEYVKGKKKSKLAKNDTPQNKKSSGKKPFYKKWWFWLLVIFVLVIVIAASGGDDDSETDMNSVVSETKTPEPHEVDPSFTSENDSESSESSALEEPKTVEEINRDAIKEVLGEDYFESFFSDVENGYSILKFYGRENLTLNLTVSGMYSDIFHSLEAIHDTAETEVDIWVIFPLTDVYGNSKEQVVIKANFSLDTIKKINFDNAIPADIPNIADEWWIHDALLG